MQIALRKRNLNLTGDERLIDGAIQFVINASAIHRLVDPAQQFKIETRLAKSSEAYARLRIRADL